MGNVFKILPLILGLVPQIIDTIKAVEVPGNGIAKKNAVLEIVTTAITMFAPDLGVKVEMVSAFASSVIDIMVGLLNASGVFKNPSRPGTQAEKSL